MCISSSVVSGEEGSSSSTSSYPTCRHWTVRRYENDDDDYDDDFFVGRSRTLLNSIHGRGRELSLFEHAGSITRGRGGATGTGASSSEASSSSSPPPPSSSSSSSGGRTTKTSSSSSARSGSSSTSTSRTTPPPPKKKQQRKSKKSVFQSARNFLTSSNAVPKLQIRVEPSTTLKLRKTFRPLKTIIKLGADFNTQLGIWQFRSSWEDSVIGGKLTLAGRELQFSKTWLLSVGAVEDLVTRLRLRAAVDLGTMKAYARIGFRTERVAAINVYEGFTLLRQIPLDGNEGHVKLEVQANVAFPEPELEFTTESQRTLVGMGDVEVNVEELNLILDY